MQSQSDRDDAGHDLVQRFRLRPHTVVISRDAVHSMCRTVYRSTLLSPQTHPHTPQVCPVATTSAHLVPCSHPNSGRLGPAGLGELDATIGNRIIEHIRLSKTAEPHRPLLSVAYPHCMRRKACVLGFVAFHIKSRA